MAKGELTLKFIPSKQVAERNGKRFVVCEECGTLQFPIAPVTKINNMVWSCRNPKCKTVMIINIWS